MKKKMLCRGMCAALLAATLCTAGCRNRDLLQSDVYNVPTMSEEEMISVYNQAADRFAAADNYTMTGTVCDWAEIYSEDEDASEALTEDIDDGPSAVANAFVCKAGKANGGRIGWFEVDGNYETKHNTYYDGTNWYYSDIDGVEPFGSDVPLYNDYFAEDYVPPIAAADVLFVNMERPDGEITMTLRLPLTAFQSPAMDGRTGFYLDEAADSVVTITMTFSDEMEVTGISVSWTSKGDFVKGDIMEQGYEAFFTVSDFGTTTVPVPEDLDRYEISTDDVDEGDQWAYKPPEGWTPEDDDKIDWESVTWEELEALGWTRIPIEDAIVEYE